jgi:hypothetical protein
MKRIAKLPAVLVLLTASLGCVGRPDETGSGATPARPTLPLGEPVNVSRPESTLQIRHPWNRDEGVRVRLDADRLRAYNLSREGVVEALTPSGFVDPKEPLPPTGVVFVKHLSRPELYENVILRADAEGNIVRLKDVGQVDAEPSSRANPAHGVGSPNP